MKTWSSILAVMIALVLCVSVAEAAKGAKPLRGKITKVDGANVTITTKDGTETTVATTDSTEVTINGEKKTVADLPTGKNARVTLGEDGKTATAISVGKAKAAESAPATQAQ
jgi:ribosome maturation factor RimP